MNYNILFVGGVYEEGCENEYLKKSSGGIQNAVNLHQWNIIDAIESVNSNPVDILSARYLGTFPLTYSDLYTPRKIWSHNGLSNDENIMLINLPVIKTITKILGLRRKTKTWVKNKNGSKIIFCYYPALPQMLATINLKKYDVKTILIIPDIPKYMNLQQDKKTLFGYIKKKIRAYSEKLQNSLIKKYDGYIVLTRDMIKALDINKDYSVIEAFVNKKLIDESSNSQAKEYCIVYSGSLHKKYGLDLYIDSINLIQNNNIKFYFFGSGEMEEIIKEKSKTDKRIQFMGYQPANVVQKYQRSATLLINPRKNDEEYTKYSFPSKLIEYMASGTPVISSRLKCIPKEYDRYLIYIQDPINPTTIANSITNALSLGEQKLREIGRNARQFIIDNKTTEKQGYKIEKLVNQIYDKNS